MTDPVAGLPPGHHARPIRPPDDLPALARLHDAERAANGSPFRTTVAELADALASAERGELLHHLTRLRIASKGQPISMHVTVDHLDLDGVAIAHLLTNEILEFAYLLRDDRMSLRVGPGDPTESGKRLQDGDRVATRIRGAERGRRRRCG